ncbi:hypothetical protein [Hydrogenoanaerobacterium saccharovorans]|uniref:hypothetical protein n=1 Tax=Hydrogenoanaerobacterium saccharovorans TaxID=474960 RepID=UPI000B88C2F3|nr:hypothetical protein [Hydrogenoanaerobacterium saccharovorans]
MTELLGGFGGVVSPIAYPRGNKKVLYGVNPYNTRIQVQFAYYALQNGFVWRIISMQSAAFMPLFMED